MSGTRVLLAMMLTNLCAQRVSSTSGCTVDLKQKACNFVCDCWDCSDEKACGYRPESHSPEVPFTCDFELDTCGWRDVSTSTYRWIRDRGGISMYGTGPVADHTLGTAWGWYMAAEAHRGKIPTTARLRSPVLRNAAATCEVRIHYHMWEGGLNETSEGSLTVQLSDSKQTYEVWQSPPSIIYRWREIVFYTGRISGEFEITLLSTRNFSARGDLAIDDVSFLHCALPQPQRECPPGWFQCIDDGSCVEQDRVCDGTFDCGSGEDENNCTRYNICPFTNDFGIWTNAHFTRVRSSNSKNTTRPPKDHTDNSPLDYFLFAENTPDGKVGTATLKSPTLNVMNNNDSCVLVLYYLMSGSDMHSLKISYEINSEVPTKVEELKGQMGSHWFRERVVFNIPHAFQIVIEGQVADEAKGGIALDDLILSPGCGPFEGNVPDGTTPAMTPAPTHGTTQGTTPGSTHATTHATTPGTTHETTLPIARSKVLLHHDNGNTLAEHPTCKFKEDCMDGSDGNIGGAAIFEGNATTWTDHSVGRLKWVERHSCLLSDNSKVTAAPEPCLSLEAAGGQMLTAAEMRWLSKGPTGAACALQLSFYLDGGHKGFISASVVDSKMGTDHLSWYVQGERSKVWKPVKFPLGERPQPFQVKIRGWVPHHIDGKMSAGVKDIRFVDCDLNTPNATISCNFEMDMCGWYQDQSDDFEWARGDGSHDPISNHKPDFDHTTGSGYFLYADPSSGMRRGIRTRLHTYLQGPASGDQCLSFWYHMYGSQTGTLNLKIRHEEEAEKLLWTRKGSHGNSWHLGFHTLSHNGMKYQLIFEALHGGSLGDIAIDDIILQSGPCVAQKHCSFEDGMCGYSTEGTPPWVRQSNFSGLTRGGPALDHTTETFIGQYMIVDTSNAAMPSGTKARMKSEQHKPLSGDGCLGLWYHMSSGSAETLNIYVEEQTSKQVLSISKQPGGTWHYSSITIQAENPWKVTVEAVGAGADLAFIAVDDIHLNLRSCPKLGTCDFESDACGWSTTKKSQLESHDWDWSSGATQRRYHAPRADHTLGTKEGHYIFFDTDLLNPGENSAWLVSEQLPATTSSCLKFWYRTDSEEGLHPGDLRVKTHSSAGQLTMWSVQGHRTTGWQEARIPLTSSVEFQLVFEAAKGAMGVTGAVALDDLEYIASGNCDSAVKAEEKPNDKKDNSAVIVFGVILGTILLVVAVALVLRWVRKRQQAQLSEEPARVEGLGGFDNLTFEEDTQNFGVDS